MAKKVLLVDATICRNIIINTFSQKSKKILEQSHYMSKWISYIEIGGDVVGI